MLCGVLILREYGYCVKKNKLFSQKKKVSCTLLLCRGNIYEFDLKKDIANN
jgi:hypothetical protein